MHCLHQKSSQMIKSRNATIESKLIDIRSRGTTGVIEGSFLPTQNRLGQLSASLELLENTVDSELFRYFPVAAIAVLESHFRHVIASFIDAGEPYRSRGLLLIKDSQKSAIEVLSLVKGSVSLGEMVAFALPFNSVANIETALDGLLGESIKKLIAGIRWLGYWPQRHPDYAFVGPDQYDPGPLIENVTELWRALAITFEHRHIVAHEAAPSFQVSHQNASQAIWAVSAITDALDVVLWTTAWKEEPITFPERRDKAVLRIMAARRSIAAVLRQIRKLNVAERTASLRALHLGWKRHRKNLVDFASIGMVGSPRVVTRCEIDADAYETWLETVRAL